VEHLAETVDWAAQEAVAEVETREPPWSGVTQLFLTYGSLGGVPYAAWSSPVCVSQYYVNENSIPQTASSLHFLFYQGWYRRGVSAVKARRIVKNVVEWPRRWNPLR
jgi:hypothetical protein